MSDEPIPEVKASRDDALARMFDAALRCATTDDQVAVDYSAVHAVPVGPAPMPHGWTHDLRHTAWEACAAAMRATGGRWVVRATVQAGMGKVRVLFFRDGPGVVP